MDFLQNLWTNHRIIAIILAVVLLPITLGILGLKLYEMFNNTSAKKSLESAQNSDNKLAQKEDELKKQANASVAEADKAAQRIEDRHTNEEVDLDWHTKRKD